MGLSWQQGPLSPGAIGRFLVPEPLPKRLLYAEPLRRRMRVRFGGTWIADSENVLLLFEPGHYPIAYFPETDVSPDILQRSEHTTRHPELGLTCWYTVVTAVRAVWFRGRSSMNRSHWKSPPSTTFSFAAHNRLATSSSICEFESDSISEAESILHSGSPAVPERPSRPTARDIWPQVED